VHVLFIYFPKATSSVRKLLNGAEVSEKDTPIDLIVHTKAPSKWKLIDMETGQEYVGSLEITQYGRWIRVKDRS
jgi:hypothetical protein